MNCPRCGSPISAHGTYCQNCGQRLEPSNVYAVSQNLPPQNRPLSPWAYFGYQFLFSIPLVGLICLIIFSFNEDNINLRNYARSYWCALLVGLIIMIVFTILGVSLGFSQRIAEAFSQLSNL